MSWTGSGIGQVQVPDKVFIRLYLRRFINKWQI